MPRPTRDDAHLMLELATWYTASGVGEAANWVRSNEYVSDFTTFDSRYRDGSEGRLRVNTYLGFHETVATLWKNGLVNEELLFDWLWVTGPWDRVKDVAVGMREKMGVAALWENFEAMAERQRALTSKPVKKARKPAAPARSARTRTSAPRRRP